MLFAAFALVLAAMFSAQGSCAQDASTGASASPPAVSSAALAASPRPRRREYSADAPPDVWPRTGRVRVYVHRAAKTWSPVSVRIDSRLAPSANSVSIRVREERGKKGRRRRVGTSLAADAKAFWRPYQGNHELVVSLYPEAWKKRLMHLEIHYIVSVGYLEGASAELVKVQTGGVPREESAGSLGIDGAVYDPRTIDAASWKWGLDSYALDERGISFSEEFAGRGDIALFSLNPADGKGVRNAARGENFDFGDQDVGRVDFSYRVVGVRAEK